MAVFFEGGKSPAAEGEPIGLLTEGAAAIAVIVLAIIGLSRTQPGILASIATIVIGVALMVQGFNTAAEYSRVTAASIRPDQPGAREIVAARAREVGGDVMVNFAAGIAGIVLGILGLLSIHTVYLIPAAAIVFGAALVLAGMAGLGRGPVQFPAAATPTAPPATLPAAEIMTQTTGSAGASGLEVIAGFAAVILGILAVMLTATTWALALVALLVVGAALLVVSASFATAVSRLFMATY
jgi:hypothetical protein